MAEKFLGEIKLAPLVSSGNERTERAAGTSKLFNVGMYWLSSAARRRANLPDRTLATGLAKEGYRGYTDGDITGPSIPKILV